MATHSIQLLTRQHLTPEVLLYGRQTTDRGGQKPRTIRKKLKYYSNSDHRAVKPTFKKRRSTQAAQML